MAHFDVRRWRIALASVPLALSTLGGTPPAQASECINDVPLLVATDTYVCTFTCSAGSQLSVYARGWMFTVTATCGGASASCSLRDVTNQNESCLRGGGDAWSSDSFGECRIKPSSVAPPVGQKLSVHCNA